MKMLTQPYLLTLSPDSSMDVIWIQSHPLEGTVEYGYTEALGNTVTAKSCEIKGLHGPREDGTFAPVPEGNPLVSVYRSSCRIEGLLPGKKVYYRCRCGDIVTQTYFFMTAPEKGGDFKFAQLSDLQGLEGCNETVYKIGCQHPDFILYSGDATYISWRIDSWFDTGEDWQDSESRKKAFFPCMQQQNGARLLQYAPMFFCPGNHELDDLRCYTDKSFNQVLENWRWSIFMQLFSTYYDTEDTGLDGKRWYSVNYGDLHIISLNINRFCFWKHNEFPGWRLYDPIDPDKPQLTWLKQDLENDNSKFKWVIQHFHILNKGGDVQFNLCSPVIDEDGKVTYPNDYGSMLMDLYSEYSVNAVSFGHSHVYERYYRKSTHYIEAAYLSVCFRRGGEPPHPSGLLPVCEDNSKRSFLIVERKKGGLFATGYYADDIPVPFDCYMIADENGVSVAP